MENCCTDKGSSKKIEDWEVDDALRTLTRAEEIRNKPALMKLVDKKAKEQKEILSKLEIRKSLLYGNNKGDNSSEN